MPGYPTYINFEKGSFTTTGKQLLMKAQRAGIGYYYAWVHGLIVGFLSSMALLIPLCINLIALAFRGADQFQEHWAVVCVVGLTAMSFAGLTIFALVWHLSRNKAFRVLSQITEENPDFCFELSVAVENEGHLQPVLGFGSREINLREVVYFLERFQEKNKKSKLAH